MNQARITILASQERRLRTLLEGHSSGHERAAAVLFRRLQWSGSGISDSDRYIAVDVIPFEDHWIMSSSASHVAFEMKYLRDIFRRCADESLVFGFAHIHPGGPSTFSDIDDANEVTLVTAIKNRNGPQIHFVALLLAQGRWKARIRSGVSPNLPEPVRHIVVLDQPLRIHLNDDDSRPDELLARQLAAFGAPFVAKLGSLRVGIVGAGGTGSPTITLLSRAGVREIILIDGDRLERSNLNRVRGATVADVGKNKAQLLSEFVEGLGFPVQIHSISSYIDLNPIAVDALASCDIVFGCTDDQIGRELLNAALYVYAQVYIDVGLGGQIVDDPSGQPHLKYHFGRVSTILPEAGECLFCQGVLKEEWIRHQYALRESPALTMNEARDRYLEGGREQAPGIGPFTSAVADYGVATLFDLIKPFRNFPPELRKDFFTIDFVRMALRSRREKNDPTCMYCKHRVYLLQPEEYRLNRPALEKRNAAL